MTRIQPIRLFPKPVPMEGALDAPFYSPRLNYQWFKFVWGLIPALLQEELWEGTEAEIQHAIRQVELLLSLFDFPCAESPSGVQPQEFLLGDGDLMYRLVEGECSTLPQFALDLHGNLYWRPIPEE